MSSRNYRGTDIKADYYAAVNAFGRDPLGEAIYGRDKLLYVRPSKNSVAEAPIIKDLYQPGSTGLVRVHWFPFANWRQQVEVDKWLFRMCTFTITGTRWEEERKPMEPNEYSLDLEHFVPGTDNKPGRYHERSFYCVSPDELIKAKLLAALELAFFLEE